MNAPTSMPAFAPVLPEEPERTPEEEVANKILHLLTVYPIISPSMLQIGIGSSIPTKVWRPVFNDLITRKLIKQDDFASLGASGRAQSYSLISLIDTPVYFPKF